MAKEKTYQELIKPFYVVKLNDVVVPTVTSITVTQNGHQEADSCSINLSNTKDNYNYLLTGNSLLIEIDVGYFTWEKGKRGAFTGKIFYGKSDSVNLRDDKSGGNYITIEGRDFTSLLIDAIITYKFSGKTPAEIVAMLCKDAGLSLRLNVPEGLNKAYPEFEVDEESFWDVITRLASDLGLDIYVTDTTLYFGVFEDEVQDVFEFVAGQNLVSLNVSVKTPNSVPTEVEVRAYKDKEQKIIGSSSTAQMDTIALQKTKKLVINDLIVTTEMAHFQALQQLYEIQRQLFTITITSQYGIPFVKSSKLIKITNKKNLDGYYWIRSITHKMDKSGGYTMDIEAEKPPYGLRWG